MTSGKMVDLDALEKLAKEARPGPWFARTSRKIRSGVIHVRNADGHYIMEKNHAPRAKDDAYFIAAANPATILAMIRELRAAREVVRMYVDEPKERMEKMRAAGHVFHDEAEQQAIFEQTMDSIERDAAIGGEGPR